MAKKFAAWWSAHKPTTRRLIQVYAALLGHTPTVDEIDEAISAGHNAYASMRRTTDADRDRDCSLDMAVSYGLDCTSEEERREDYYSVRGLK